MEGQLAVEEDVEQSRISTRMWAIRAAVVVVLIIVGVYAFHKVSYALSHESTDDAYVDGVVVPISAEVKGRVTKVLVTDNQYVKKGDVLLELFPEDYNQVLQTKESMLSRLSAERQELLASLKAKTMALARVKADLAAAATDAALADKDFLRAKELLKEQVVSQRQYDQAESRKKSTSAHQDAASAAVAEMEAAIEALNAQLATQSFRIKEANASADLAKLDLQRTVITAPVGGRIAKKNVDTGKYVEQGQPLLAIVEDTNLWIVANFKETQIAHMRVGQPVDLTVDAYPGVPFEGHVDSFQPGTGAVFSILPPQNATGNFVKVVQRVPVKILIDSKFDPAHPLWPGLSVYPSVFIAGNKN